MIRGLNFASKDVVMLLMIVADDNIKSHYVFLCVQRASEHYLKDAVAPFI